MHILRAVFRPALCGFHGVCPSTTSILRSRLLQRLPQTRSCHTLPPLRTGCPNIKRLRALRFPDSRSLSTGTVQPEADASKLPVLAPPAVGRWLLFSSALVFAVIVVGGVTRLTESGLSITEWRPIAGIIPPLNGEDWNAEFEKYKVTPEFKLSVYSSSSSIIQSRLNRPDRINHSISLDEFKNIFYMEWGHRVLGRIIGIAFVLPLSYFAVRKKLTTSMPAKLTGMALLLGFQGVLGWYMVKSGLEDSIMDTPGAMPRVSQYRLAAHLGTAILLYAGMLGTGLAAVKDWKYAHSGLWSGSKTMSWQEVLSNPAVKRFTRYSRALTSLVFLTALSGRWRPRWYMCQFSHEYVRCFRSGPGCWTTI